MVKVIEYQDEHFHEISQMLRGFRQETARLKGREIEPTQEDAVNELNEHLENGNKILVALMELDCAGFLIMRSMDGVWWVDTLYTLPSHRREGIASALYEAAEKLAAGGKADNLFVWVHPNNNKMLGFLKSRGYDVLNLIEVRRPWRGERFTRTYGFGDQDLRY